MSGADDAEEDREAAENLEVLRTALRVADRHVGHLQRSRDAWRERALAAEKLAADQQDLIFGLQQLTKGAA